MHKWRNTLKKERKTSLKRRKKKERTEDKVKQRIDVKIGIRTKTRRNSLKYWKQNFRFVRISLSSLNIDCIIAISENIGDVELLLFIE